MKSREDLLDLINYSKKALYGEDVEPITISQLTFYSNPSAGGKRYRQFNIAKSSGQYRAIHAPVQGLLLIQRCLNLILSCIYKPTPQAHGFTPGRSVKTNAFVHVGNYYVFNVDLKDFFPSIDQARIWRMLQLPPFNLVAKNDSRISPKNRYELASMISAICCTSMLVDRIDRKGNLTRVVRNVLPQGAPTSPFFSNMICQRLDQRLMGVAKRFGLKYTRYADDITFSSLHNVFHSHNPFIVEMRRIITEQGFTVNEDKVRLQRTGYRQMVTGLVVNEKVNVTREFIKSLRKSLYLLERYNEEKASQAYIKDNKLDDVSINDIDIQAIVTGKIAYLKDILGKNSPRYLSYKTRIDQLYPGKGTTVPVEKVDAKTLARNIDRVKHNLLNNELPTENASFEELRAFVRLLRDENSVSALLVDKAGQAEEDEIHDPNFVVSVLEKFTSETHLKYATHYWDTQDRYKNYNVFRKSIMEDVRLFKLRLLPRYNSHLYWKVIHPFLIRDKPDEKKSGEKFEYQWGRHKLKVGLQYPGILEEWMQENPGKSPFSMPIPKELRPPFRISGKSLTYFEDFVDEFKNEIEFRRNDLHYLIKDITSSMEFDFDISITNLKGLSFYTDTYQVEQALRIIFNAIRKYPGAPKIIVNGSYDTEAKFIDIDILHIDSFCDRPLNDRKLQLMDKRGDFFTIRKLLNSLCDWSIQSRFRVGNEYTSYTIHYLNSTGAQNPEKSADALGFLHKLRFYL
ncbi:reverse transcriptase family protein [Pedobacter sp. Bi27]|uniref:reverse transcriptase family protein n=1 Tax=Pedobacter sp. Bi27 TaxID=2822351 RepID=UPI001E3146E9|nr:reverse transcriptase family protein [Pedobacter sp. Bi27]